jgi:hypothetical protein
MTAGALEARLFSFIFCEHFDALAVSGSDQSVMILLKAWNLWLYDELKRIDTLLANGQ